MSRVKLTVTVDDQHMDSMSAVTEDLQSKGFVVERVVKMAGAIFGSAEMSSISSLSHSNGVAEVRPERAYQLPPMDPSIPQ